jgi:hypothetical protein
MLASRLERHFAFTARSIVEHGQVIARLFEEHTVLPMRFGTFFRSEKQVIDLVRENRQSLLESFCRLRGKAEMRLKLLLGFGGPAAAETQLRRMPQRALVSEDMDSGDNREPLDPQCREVASQLANRLQQMFRPLDQQVTCRRLEGSQLLVDCAHLIETERVEAYQKQCQSQTRDFAMRVTGPWPPYHFLPSSVRLPAVGMMTAPPRSRVAPRVAIQAL